MRIAIGNIVGVDEVKQLFENFSSDVFNQGSILAIVLGENQSESFAALWKDENEELEEHQSF